jgi:hypothetical protein
MVAGDPHSVTFPKTSHLAGSVGEGLQWISFPVTGTSLQRQHVQYGQLEAWASSTPREQWQNQGIHDLLLLAIPHAVTLHAWSRREKRVHQTRALLASH